MHNSTTDTYDPEKSDGNHSANPTGARQGMHVIFSRSKAREQSLSKSSSLQNNTWKDQ
jgi:hypothetical protein